MMFHVKHYRGVSMGMAGFAKRLRKAFRAWEDQVGRDVTETELGELVGKKYDGSPISQASVNRWFSGTLPDHGRMVALAEVIGADPGWLAYGPDEDQQGEQGAKPINGTPAPRIPVTSVNIDDFTTKDIPVPDEPRKGKKQPRKNSGRSAMAS
jgi:hypothetical protein